MADENENGNGGNNQSRTGRVGRVSMRVDSISSRQATIGNVEVQRLNVRDGTERVAGDEILEDIRKVMTEQTVTLEKAIRESVRALGRVSTQDRPTSTLAPNKEITDALEHIRSAIVASTNAKGGEGGGGGESGVDGYAEQMRNQRIYEQLNKKTQGNQKRILDLQDAVAITMANFEEVFAQINTKLEEAVSSLSRFSNVTDYVTERFRTSMEAARSGVASFYDIMVDDLALGGLRNERDSLLETFKLVRTAAENDIIAPLGFMGNNIEQVAKSLRAMRENVDDMGYDLYGRFDFRQFNESMLMLFQEQRRGNIQANLNNSDTTKSITRQLKFMDLIAQNTGRTVEEIVKQSQQDRQYVSELRASTILDREQQENYVNAITQLTSNNQTEFARLVKDLAANAGNTAAFLGQNTDLANSLVASNNIQNLENLAQLLNEARGLNPQEFQTRINDIIRTFQPNNGPGGIVGSRVYSEQARSLFGEANITRDQVTRQREDDEGGIAGVVNRIQDFFTNEVPWSSVAFVSAIGINTLALMRNTAALSGRGGMGRTLRAAGLLDSTMTGPDGKPKTFRGRFRPQVLTRTAGNMVKAPFKAAGSFLGGVGRVAGGLGARLLPGIGALYGGIDAASRISEGDYLGGLISTGAGLASLIPGIGTAASLGLYGLNTARDAGVFDSFGTDTPGQGTVRTPKMYTPEITGVGGTIPSPKSSDNPTISILSDIRDEMRNSNDINRSIERNTKGGGENTIVSKDVDIDRLADSIAKGVNRGSRPRRPAVPYSGAENMHSS